MTHYLKLTRLLLLLFLCGCSSTKYVPEGSFLLDKVALKTDNKQLGSSQLVNYVRQRPNSKWFNRFKVQLGIYNLSGSDSTKWLNRVVRRVGEEPVVFKSELVTRSATEIQKAAVNLGYLRAQVTPEVLTKRKKKQVIYRIISGPVYQIGSIELAIDDPIIKGYLEEDQKSSLIKAGANFDANVLDQERQRMADLLLRKGYFKFNKEYLSFDADTFFAPFKVYLSMNLLNYQKENVDSFFTHKQYRINEISYVIDYDLGRSGLQEQNTQYSILNHQGYKIYYKDNLFLRPQVLLNNTRIAPDRLYSDRGVQSSHAAFGRLKAIKHTNFKFVETELEDSTRLNAFILITKGKQKAFSVELEGTNSAGDLGAGASATFQHKNLFKGAEVLTLKVRGAYEAISGLSGYNNNNYNEFGAEATINLPNFFAPFLTSKFKRSINANTEFGLQYNTQLRPEFSRNIASARWSYKWIDTKRAQHKIDLIDVSYIYMPWISAKFDSTYLINNSLLRFNYENQLIIKAGYSFLYDSQGAQLAKKRTNNSYTIRAAVESAGNLLYLLSKPLHLQKKENVYSIFNIDYAEYVKGDFEYVKNIRIDERNSIALRSGLGIAYPYGNSRILPFEKRYFAGGANGVRGWSVRRLGPGTFLGADKAIDFMNQSGDLKLDLNMEYRSRLGGVFEGAFFVDAGNVWTLRSYEEQVGGQFKVESFYKEIAMSYGLGVRLNFDFFILRFDGGMKAVHPGYTGKAQFPIISPDFGRDFAFHFAVGYPF